MSFYIRKSIRCGPIRFNLSKSGLGISGGVKGFRVGTGPRGNYVHMGRGGLYYRKYQSKGGRSRAHARTSPSRPDLVESPLSTIPDVEMHEVESAATDQIVDSSSSELVAEFAAKRKRLRIRPILAWTLLPATILSPLTTQFAGLVIPLIILTPILLVVATIRDRSVKTVVLMYDLEPEYESLYKRLYEAFETLRKAKKLWHISAKGKTHDAKYFAGANELIRRKEVGISFKNPPFVKTNIPTPSIPVGKQTLFFFPDRVLVFENNTVGAVSYENLKLDVDEVQFIETEGVPSDSKIVGRTWKYVNKKGGPDKRFKDNRELPIALYQAVHLNSPTGLNELLHVSSVGVVQGIRECVRRVSEMTPHEVKPPPPLRLPPIQEGN